MGEPSWNTDNGLLPAIVQDVSSQRVLMVGFLNQEALEKTRTEGKVYFYSRSKQRLWMKGESSGNVLNVVSIALDCDCDAYLIKVNPAGPVCHNGTDTCFGEENKPSEEILAWLSSLIKKRRSEPVSGSYTCELVNAGLNRVAQKVGEEAIEVVIEALQGTPDKLIEESADLLYHLLVLLELKGLSIEEVFALLRKRNAHATRPSA